MVKIPENFTKYYLNSVLEKVVAPDLSPRDTVITFDLTEVTFIDAAGVAVLYNICMWLRNEEGVEAHFTINTSGSFKNRKAMEYLEDCGFFAEFFSKEKVFVEPHLRNTTLKIRMISVPDSYQWGQTTLLNWLRYCTQRNDNFSNIQVAIEEIFNNIEDHSNQKVGCAFGQFFPAINRIVITVSDFGVGIPTVMRTKFEGTTDADLLMTALREGVSTKSTPRNRGAGLPNIIRSLTNAGIGTVHILSNHAKVIIKNGKVIQSSEQNNYYPGTFFELEIDASNEALYEVEEEDEFEW